MQDMGWWSYVKYDEQQDRPAISGPLLRRVAGYARPYSGRIALMLGTIFVITGLSLIPPLLYRALIDEALPQRDLGLLNLLALGMISIPVLSGLVGIYQRFLSATVGESIIFDLRCALFEHLQRMALRFFTHTKTGELMARLNNDVVGAQQAVSTTAMSLVSNTVAVVGTLVVMLSLDWRLTVASVLILPLFLLPARRVGRILRRVTRESFRLNAQMNALMNETLNVSGALLVKLFGRTPDETARFASRAGRVRDIGVRQALIGRWFFLGLGLVSAVGTAVVFWIGGWLVLNEGLTVGTIVAFSAYLAQLYGPLAALTNARVEFATSLVSFERVFEVLDLPLEIADRPDAQALRRVRGEVRFEDVWFRYEDPTRAAGLADVTRWHWPGATTAAVSAADQRASRHGPAGRQAERDGHGEVALGDGPPARGVAEPDGGAEAPEQVWTLAGLSFAVEPGQLVALVGPSGAGKTTVTYLLPRLYDPTQGRITIDGHDLRDATLESLAAQIGTVTQETYLFHDTIRANLLYAKPGAAQGELEDACRVANLHDFVASLPERYETVVGERGYRLSGGEKQRLAIARVVLKDPRILVLDEATSHLDSESEALIQAALERVMRGRTSIVIAHRLSTVLAADVILVLDQGQLVEQGTHAELLMRGGLYARLFETQFQPAKLLAPLSDAGV